MAKEMVAQNNQEALRPWITVFVHGNYGSALTALSFNNVLNDCYEETAYAKVQHWFRKQVHTNNILPEQGLNRVNPTQSKKNKIVDAFAKAYNDTLSLVDHQQAANSMYYGFGWSGLLCQKARRQEAIALYSSLSQEIASYKKRGLNPKIRIVCHSHGGNVALNLAGIHALLNKKHFQKDTTTTSVFNISQEISPEILPTLDANLCIDELILLATPIQIETEEFVTAPLFEKVFSFYSCSDIIQIIDFVSTEGPISKHTIAPNYFKPNILQINLSVTNHIKPIAPSPIVAFIKKYLLTFSRPSKTREPSKKQALATLLKSMACGHEADNILAAVERTIQMIANLSNMPEEKNFDLQALSLELKAIQKNMIEHPNDPSHGDFVKTFTNKKTKCVDPLPLFVWTPILCRILQEYTDREDRTGSDLHATIHYCDKKITMDIEDANNLVKKVEIPEKILLDLKKQFYTYLT